MGLFSKKIENNGSQKLLVNVQPGETRIALTDSDLLVDLHIEQTSRERTVGNIYKGVVVKVNPAFQAAFIEYGEDRNGFLSISDVDPSLYKGSKQRGRPSIQSVLKNGQPLMVQVLKERIREKGAALTTSVSLPGRYMVLTANSDRSGISRRIGDAETRGRLKDVLEGLKGKDKKGVIIRTAGIDRKPAELKKDYASLQKVWKGIESKFDTQKKPGVLYQEPKSIIRVLRDYFSDEVSEVWVDDPDAYQQALKYFKAELPKFQKRLKLYQDDRSLFSTQGIEQQISALETSKVPLKSGGGLVVESTEALVAIDVNSGKSNRASDIEATALGTNLEAAEEVARQLRLRNLGGLIVVDFIDMVPQKNRDRVEQCLADAMKNDKARISIGRISEFGLLELSRQRIDVELSRGMLVQCPTCAGAGHVPTVNSSANNVLREVRAMAVTGKYQEIQGKLPLDHANFLLNHRRESLIELEQEFEITIHLTGDPSLPPGHAAKLMGSSSSENSEVVAASPGDDSVASNAAPSAGGAASSAAPNAGGAAPRGESSEGGGRPRRRRRRRGRGGNGGSAEGQGQMAEVSAEHAQAANDEDQNEPAESGNGVSAEKDAPREQGRAAVSTAASAGGPSKSADEPRTPANGGQAPANGGARPVKLVSQKRGGWLSGMDSSNVAVGNTIYKSSHQPTKEGPLPIILPSFKSSNPFVGMEVKDGDTLYDSSKMGQAASAAAPASGGEAKPSRSRRGGGKAAAGKATAGKAAKSAPKRGRATGAAKGKSASRAKSSKAG